MEELKPLADLSNPDERQLHFCIVNLDTGESRPRTIEDLHFGAAELALSKAVPEQIRTHFATAQNLIVYSWYFYPFNVTAQFLAFVTVELALKDRLESKAPFKALIRKAIEKGLIQDEGFSHIQVARSSSPRPQASSEDSQEYARSLIDTMPYLRNELAHGSTMLHNLGLSSVRLCAEFIEQLYKRSCDQGDSPEPLDQPIAPGKMNEH